MPRPRRPFSGQETITPFSVPWMKDQAVGAVGTRREARWTSAQHWKYPTPNGQQDPLTYFLVLSALVNIDPSIELRASELTKWLNEADNNLSWDAVTVGKVVSDLCDAFEEITGAKNGLLERSRDWKGTFYLLHRSEEVAKAAHSLLDDLYRLSEIEILERKAGRKTDFMGSPLAECPTTRGKWSEDA